MPKRKPTPKRRSQRRTPDARALEWAQNRLDRCEAQHATLTAKLYDLNYEIPRLREIIAVLAPNEPLATVAAVKGVATFDGLNIQQRVAAKPRMVAGMDVSRFVTPQQYSVGGPIVSDDDDALLNVADGNLPKGTPLAE